jgi:hypothetical protein
MKKAYEKPKILETMPIERVLMGEEGVAGWTNWQQSWSNGWSNWNNSWNNSGAVLPPEEGGPSEPAV